MLPQAGLEMDSTSHYMCSGFLSGCRKSTYKPSVFVFLSLRYASGPSQSSSTESAMGMKTTVRNNNEKEELVEEISDNTVEEILCGTLKEEEEANRAAEKQGN